MQEGALLWGGKRACMLICDVQGLDDDDARVIAENLSKFKRLSKLLLVSSTVGIWWPWGQVFVVRL